MEFIKARLSACFAGQFGAKLKKCLEADETTEAITTFLKGEKKCLFFPGDTLQPTFTIDSKKSQKAKFLGFVKKGASSNISAINAEILAVEIGSDWLQDMELWAHNVVLPLLANPKNQDGWGEVASKEIIYRVHTFLASVSITYGLSQGRTCLPLPQIDIDGARSKDKNRISVLEGAVITWTKQIKNVLKQDPESLLRKGVHPTPDMEIAFWRSRSANLNSIFDQLQSEKVRKVLRALDASKSTYCATFARLCKEVFTARLEANDNMKYLRTLENWFEKLNEESDLPKLMDLFKPMLHIIFLIWKNSKHYNTPTRLVVLIREIGNSLIHRACKYVSGSEIFTLIEQEQANRAVDQLKMVLKVCGAFKGIYFDYKTTASTECPENPWRIQNNALFVRLDSFLERCHDILDLTQKTVLFSRLSKIEIGGTKGKVLTSSVHQIFEDFQAAVWSFKNVGYDIMDFSEKVFDEDYYHFKSSIKELERRLGSILTQAFDDCATISGKFKLLDSFEGLLDRPIIQEELENKQMSLILSYGKELKAVQENFLRHRDLPPISRNLPPIVGSLNWCRGLIERISDPMKKLKSLHRTVLEREETKEVCKIFATIVSSLQEYENQRIEEWGRDVEASSQAKLRLPLLRRESATRLLVVNFDPALVKLLREIRYFLLLGVSVSASAIDIYSKGETYRKHTASLEMIVDMYNSMMTSMLPVEQPLMKTYIESIDRVLSRGIESLNWKSSTIEQFVSEAVECVTAANLILSTLKSNFAQVEKIVSIWSASPLMDRRQKALSPEEFERSYKPSRVARYTEIKQKSQEIHVLLRESNKILKASSGSADWKTYVDFVNNIVIEGISRSIRESLTYLKNQIKGESSTSPLLEISLELNQGFPRFLPSLSSNSEKCLREIVNDWIGGFFLISTIIKRLDIEGTCLKEVHEDPEIRCLVADISESFSMTEQKCHNVRAQYDRFSHLWASDLAKEFSDFVKWCTRVAVSGAQIVDLSAYDANIVKYLELQKQVVALSPVAEFGWLRINCQPLRQAVISCAHKWINQHTEFLQRYVSKTLENFYAFTTSVHAGLSDPLVENDYKALMKVMTHIRDVRKLTDKNKEIFGPLKDAVGLLKRHGIALEEAKIGDESLPDYLETLPMRWEATMNKAFNVKEKIMPMQALKVEQIKLEVDAFVQRVRHFRNDFRANAPFSFAGGCNDAYRQIDHFFQQARDLAEDSVKLNELEELFELQISRYQETAETVAELKLLKDIWDYKALVLATFENWKALLWTEIQTDILEEQTKALLKQLREIGTTSSLVRGWQIYRDIESNVKNMTTVLPLVNELHSPAMRDRHWKHLSVVCKNQNINPSDEKFCLDDLLGLDLHEHAEDVVEIVECANKELKIERKLEMIENVWARLELEYIPHKESEVCVIKVSEELMDSLESHQLELQTMIGMGKFVDYFRDRVLQWQKTLGNVEEVLKEWTHVSKQWVSLESIYLASADIRSQLPDDTKRFEGIDQEFKDMMKNAVATPQVVEACSIDGREELLKGLTQRLELCQKSLNEYLDLKKRIFPRFYFVSNSALLEILSNGNSPFKIMPFLGDCYDSLANLHFAEGSNTTAISMVSKDKEVVIMPQPFTMQGPVEIWLNNLTEVMKSTLKYHMDGAVESAVNWEVDKPRHSWLFEYCAQVILTTSQIYWTEETEAALEEYEGGQEDSVKRHLQICSQRLSELIQLVLGELTRSDRCKIIALITLDVHARDVVQKLIDEKVSGPLSFLWQQQLRFSWQQDNKDVNIKITDFRSKYSYEYIGNSGRLVITPLTDRCYITLTMALRLFLGGAPAGPAGTGKTETTKDLARALALCCYVFNCSDQMNYQTMADIFRGLSQTGTWGCFDEFNRINIEVLSVIATQVKTVQDAVVYFSVAQNRQLEFQHLPSGTPPNRVGYYNFMGDSISLIPTCGMFITMNPGYAGRTELPENLKVLFRSCAMIRPDLKPICENMLMSEGFQEARKLSIKFVTLYSLSASLLSPQPHYDWGLRAVKSVLRVAGMLKRAEPLLAEDLILMRALRDFNTPKIPQHDTPIFMRLVADLFMGCEIAPKQNETLRQKIIQVALDRGLRSEEGFTLKVCQYQELLDVRHSVMLVGQAGCGKSTIWKTLVGAHNLGKPKPTCIFETVNPKAVTADELYGYMTLTKDWKDGVLSIIMRGMSKNYHELGYHEYQDYKWVVLDGDIDAIWIESMNTVMDDNKVLTLVSNERIPLSDAMRMIFEVNTLKNATPATVSRAGILYINENDIGWKPFVESWIVRRTDAAERTVLPALFAKYIEPVVDSTRKGFKLITPLPLINMICTLCYLLESLLPTVNSKDKTVDALEPVFVFALYWAFGGAMSVDKGSDYRRKFHEAVLPLFTAIKLPKDALCFDYLWDSTRAEFVHWSTRVPKYELLSAGDFRVPFSSISVPTLDTIRTTFLIDCLVKRQHPVMLVGGAGTGKTTLIRDYLRTVPEDVLSAVIQMNYFTSSATVQQQLEAVIDKRSGKIFGPPATKRLIYFIDDLNLPWIEDYGTQNALELLRQHVDYGNFFDRQDLGFRKEIVDSQYLAAMNPTAGSFAINERLQRHFATIACIMPGMEDLQTIYGGILGSHLKSFNPQVAGASNSLTVATIALHQSVTQKFLPSATRFTYNWNMRELSNIFQGLVLAKPEYYFQTGSLYRLWLHECSRVFEDRLISEPEVETFRAMAVEISKAQLSDADHASLHSAPLIFSTFASPVSVTSPSYLPVPDLPFLRKVLDTKLEEYNESHSMMDLVLFDQAMAHICRIARIIKNPGGNPLLVGVGGSGKQSLAKLAAFICSYEIRQLSVTSNFRLEDLREALREMFKAAAIKQVPIVWLVTDTQIVNEKFLIYISSLLSFGWIPGLYARDELEGLFGALRNEAKSLGIAESSDSMFEFLISRAKANLHVCLCFSPVGSEFRVRSRRFPGLVLSTVIDYFHPWPKDALISVAQRFLEDLDLQSADIKNAISHHMAEVHLSVKSASTRFLAVQRRFNYVTPKSFLELISFYKHLLEQKRKDQDRLIERLDVGLSTLKKTAKDVAELQIDLKLTMAKVEEKKLSTSLLLEQMDQQRSAATIQKDLASAEETKASEASLKAATIEMQAEKELSQAKPAMDKAAAAVDCLSKAMLTELKSLPKPPTGVDKVTKACLIMVEKEYKDHKWERAKKMMAQVDRFKETLQAYDGRAIPDEVIQLVEPLVTDPEFTFENMQSKSAAAANLCNWVVNIYAFNRIYVKVKPLMDSLEEARRSKGEAEQMLSKARAVVAEVEAQLQQLEEKFEQASNEKRKVEQEAQACQERLQLAERLVNGLSSENERWAREIENLRKGAISLTGDVLLSAAFVSYIGAFDQRFRNELWRETWIPDLISRLIPLSDNIDPLQILSSEGKNAKMLSQGLPSDRISIENGAIISNCKRWPLIVDPQLQGVKWLKAREEESGKCSILQLTHATWQRQVENAVTNGWTVIIENLAQDIDATLNPILARAVYKKGRVFYLRFGGDEVEYDPNFKLYLQTKLSNPHYKPEIAAQCTIINFIATEAGLEEQLLARVVNMEQPDLERKKQELVQAFQRYKIQLVELEDQLLERLSNAPDDILSDIPLIESLEATKAAAVEINAAVVKGRETEIAINQAREIYRRVAIEGAMLYFILTSLSAIDHMYQYSLDSFTEFFKRAVERADTGETQEARVLSIRESLRYTIYTWVSRGLFQSHKLIFLTQLCFNLIKRKTLPEEVGDLHMQFLLKGPKKQGIANPLSWLPESYWNAVQALSELEEFNNFASDLVEGASPRFREWYNHNTPETEKLPLDWAGLDRNPFLKLLVVRCLRPDRLTVAVSNYIETIMPHGTKYINCDASLNMGEIMDRCRQDSGPITPLYFILSPGADVVGDLDRMAARNGFIKGETYHNVSMGQGQDLVAMERLEQAHRNGHWVLLNNIHLMPRWMVELEKKLDEFAQEGSHQKFRLFLTSEPSKAIPIGILSRSIKLTNEPPSGLRANFKRALASFSKEYIDESDSRMKSILFGLCYFHSVIMERKRFGALGFNMMYPFSLGDLRDSSVCLSNYMENSAGGKIPWADLKYIFGEIMYGGHIVNDFDRLIATSYLDFYMKEELLDETELYPFAEEEKDVTFVSPAPISYEKYFEYIDEFMKSESPVAFGLHPNAEINFRTQQSETMFTILMDLQPNDASAGEGNSSPQSVAERVVGEVLDHIGDKKFDTDEILRTVEEQGPYQNVFLQECVQMNALLEEIIRSLNELSLGFAGELTMSDNMEILMDSLYTDRVPKNWAKLAWPSLKPLGGWLHNMSVRILQLEEWTQNPSEIPKSTWISGLFNPQSFLTAICQVTAQRNQLELDKLVIQTEVSKKMTVDDVETSSFKDGAMIHGLSLQGARWDSVVGFIERARPKEMFSQMPVIICRAISAEKLDKLGSFDAPCYKTEQRDPTFVFCAQLKTQSPPARWILAGVALILETTA